MTDIDPALIGLGGVVVGALITQVADSIRWSRERRHRRRERRQSALVQALGCASDVSECSLNFIPLPGPFAAAASVNYDFTALDRATAALQRAVLELRVVAAELDPQILGMQTAARGVADAAYDLVSGGAPTMIEARAVAFDASITDLLAAAGQHGLLAKE